MGKGDRIPVSMQKHEVQYIAKKFGISGEAAAGAIRATGPMREKVYAYIKAKEVGGTLSSRGMQAGARKKPIAARRSPSAKVQPQSLPFRTRGWAIGVLLDCHAIAECPDHGHIRERGSWPHAMDDARASARSHPFAGATSEQCLAAIDEIMRSVGDACPEC